VDIGATDSSTGRRFAEALAAKDFAAATGLLDPAVDFRAMTPNRFWEAGDPETVAGEILDVWFDPEDTIDEVVEIEEGGFSDCERVSYRFRGRNPDGPFVVEQQAYYTERDGLIDWMRVLCTGFRAP
jgi:hypothetical protein